ncbi:hypothetical protein BJY01DRAFT_101584 [Aspergillus pseudoustus]|uniref:Uncharacterized protein n=1 Tax=Aspergillus pseudoustus TaxID=1810923 RepID=A0ABR4IYC1_9EURO
MMPTYIWEVRMGYSDYRDGNWSPKSVARSVISREMVTMRDEGLLTANISDFKFWVEHDPRLSIRVELTGFSDDKPTYEADELGTFQLRDQQLVLVGEEGLPTTQVLLDGAGGSRRMDIVFTIWTRFLKYPFHKEPGYEVVYILNRQQMLWMVVHRGLRDEIADGSDYEWIRRLQLQTNPI